MDLENFEVILKQLQDMGYRGKMSYHFYGEPLLHPKLNQFIELTKKTLPEVRSEIFSNGVYLTKAKFDSLRKSGVDKFTITRHKDAGKIAFEETFALLSEEEKKSVKYYGYEQLIYTSRGGLVEAGKKVETPLKRMCLIPQCTIVITKDGNVLACYEDYKEKNIMGNVFQEHLRDIWEKPQYREFRENLKKGQRYLYDVCRNCNNMQVLQ